MPKVRDFFSEEEHGKHPAMPLKEEAEEAQMPVTHEDYASGYAGLVCLVVRCVNV